MAKYTYLDKTLHRQFLGDHPLSNYLFQRLLIKSKKLDEKLLENSQFIFVTGLARAGTTALLNRLYASENLSSILYSHMPFVLNPKIANLFLRYFNNKSTFKVERSHNDGILINNKSPECLDEVFWIKAYKNYFHNDSFQVDEINKDLLKGYGYLLFSFADLQKKSRILVKNNNNHTRLLSLSRFFKKSIFLFLFRDPFSHAKSLLKQHINFLELQKRDPFVREYMHLIGHREFGIDAVPFTYPSSKAKWYLGEDKENLTYWIKQWIETHKWILNVCDLKINNLKLICYEKLCKDQSHYKKLSNFLNIENKGIDFIIANNETNYHKEFIPLEIRKESYEIYERLLQKAF